MKFFKDTENRRNVAFCVLLLLVVYVMIQSFAVTSNLMSADDVPELAYVKGMSSWTQLLGKDYFGLFRPVKNLLFKVLSSFDSSDVSGFRLICIGIGVFSFFPILLFCRRVFEGGWRSLIAASIWLLAPTLVSSVAWLSCVNIQIMSALFVLAICMHDDNHPVHASVCMLLACLSYESAVAIGPVIVAFDFFLRPSRFRTWRAWRLYGSYATLLSVYLFVRWFAGSAASVGGSFAGMSRAGLMCASAYFTMQHFAIWLWPFNNMAVFGSYSAGQVTAFGHIGCWLLIVALATAALVLRGRAPRFSFGIAMAFLAFMPTSNIIGVGNGPYGDYYMDVPSIGLSISFVSALMWLMSTTGRFAKIAVSIGVVMLLSRVFAIVESARWAYLWADGERAFKSTIATFPQAYHGFVAYAQMLCDRDDLVGALALCDEAERLVGMDEEKLRNVNIIRAVGALRGEKNAQKALVLLEKCENGCKRAPFVRSCRFYRGCVAEDLLNNMDLAQREYEAALPEKLGSDDIRTADRLARLYAIGGRVEDAIALWRTALKICPYDFSVMWNLSIALRDIGHLEESAALQERVRKTMPEAVR